MNKLRHREVKQPIQHYTTKSGHSILSLVIWFQGPRTTSMLCSHLLITFFEAVLDHNLYDHIFINVSVFKGNYVIIILLKKDVNNQF